MMGDSNRRKKRPIARALHQFVGQAEHELTFSPGEAILLLRRVDDNWLEGELNGSVGIFPANRVRIDVGSPSLSQDSALARSGRPFAVVLHDFPANMEGDLSLDEGQVVELLGTVAAGWMRGRINGSIGIFPSSFVEVVQPLRVAHKRPVPRPRGGRGGSSPPVPKPRTKKNNGRSLNNLTTNNDSLDSNHDNREDQLTPSNSESCLYRTVSGIEQDISELTASLLAEEKMMESVSGLLEVCNDETKRSKLSSSLEGHSHNVTSYTEKLTTMEAERDRLLSQGVATPPATPPSPMVTSKPDSDAIKRQHIIQELYDTERDYHNELQALREKVLPSFKQCQLLGNYESIFCNIEEVADLSGRLAEALKSAGGTESTSEGAGSVGVIFKQFTAQIRDVYATYCKGHDSASQLLEKLLEDTSKAEVIKQYFNLGRPDISSWDLHTLLIKPVQRIVKYPLLLDSLMKATPTDAKDYKALRQAVDASSQVARDINEIRRRKDILERYTGAGRDEKRRNFGTLRKKVRRLNQSLVQKTGLRAATVDAKYDREEAQVLALENTLRALQQNILAWIEEGQRLFECRDIVMSAVQLYMGDDHPLTLDSVRVMETAREKWITSSETLHSEVLDPLIMLLDLFHDPLLLMNKRGDKLLDYDSLQHDLEKTSEPDKLEPLRERVTLARRTYEALNVQLLEDLPMFNERVGGAGSLILTRFIQYQADLHYHLSHILHTSSSVGEGEEGGVVTPQMGVVTSQTIVSQAITSLQVISADLSTLSIVPTTLGLAFGQRSVGVAHPSSRPTLTKSLSSSGTRGSSLSGTRATSHSPPPVTKTRPVRNRRLSMPPRLHNTDPIYEEIPSGSVRKCDADPFMPHPPLDEEDLTVDNETTEIDTSHTQSTKDHTHSSDYDHVPHEPVTIAESLDKLFTGHKTTPTQLLEVQYDFEADNDTELTVCEGESVMLLSDVDTQGNKEWCLVVNQHHQQGYVPCNYLSEH